MHLSEYKYLTLFGWNTIKKKSPRSSGGFYKSLNFIVLRFFLSCFLVTGTELINTTCSIYQFHFSCVKGMRHL
jgi:hypothetical protein